MYVYACVSKGVFLFVSWLLQERESAGRLARSQAGQAMMQDVAKEAEKAKTFTPGGGAAAAREGLTAEHRRIYAERIEKAATVEEVGELTLSLLSLSL